MDRRRDCSRSAQEEEEEEEEIEVGSMMRSIGACRADERSQNPSPSSIPPGPGMMRSMGVLLRCLCAPLVSLRVGIVNRLASLLCPIPQRGRLNLIMTPASRLEMSFAGDDGRTHQLFSISTQPHLDDPHVHVHVDVDVQEIAADPSGRSFLVKLTHPHPQVFYYWISEKSSSHGLHLLNKMRDILTRRPTLSHLTGISTSRLDSLATHMQACLLNPNLAVALSVAVSQSLHSETALAVSSVSANLPSMLPSSPSSSSPSPSPSPSSSSSSNKGASLSPRDKTCIQGHHVSPLEIPSLTFNSPSASQSLASSAAIVGLSAALPPDFSPFNPLTFQFPLPPADHCSMDKQPHVKPQYCLYSSNLSVSYVSSALPPLPLPIPLPLHLPPVVGPSSLSVGMATASSSNCTKVLHDPLVRLPLPVSSFVIPPLHGCSQFAAYKGLMSDPIVYVPVMVICSAGQAYLVSAGPSISSAVPPLVVKPLVATTESLVEKNARETLLRLLESGTMPSPIHAVAFGVDVSSSAVTSVEIDPCLEDLSNEVSVRGDNEVEGDECGGDHNGSGIYNDKSFC